MQVTVGQSRRAKIWLVVALALGWAGIWGVIYADTSTGPKLVLDLVLAALVLWGAYGAFRVSQRKPDFRSTDFAARVAAVLREGNIPVRRDGLMFRHIGGVRVRQLQQSERAVVSVAHKLPGELERWVAASMATCRQAGLEPLDAAKETGPTFVPIVHFLVEP